MKIQTLFDLLRASQDLLLAFEGVVTKPQLVSRLEALKRADLDDLLADVENLRDAVDAGLNDTIEMNGYVADGDDTPDGLDEALKAFPELDHPQSNPPTNETDNDNPVTQDVKEETPAT